MNTIFVGTYEGRLLGYTLSHKNKQWALTLEYAVETHIGAVKSLASHMVNKIPSLLSGGVDESIRIFNLNEAKETGTILFHHGDITSLTFVGEEFLLSGGADGNVVLWRTKDWSRVRTLGKHKNAVDSICVHPSNKVALSIGADKRLCMWNLVKGNIGFSRKLPNRALKVAFSPNGNEYALLYNNTAAVYTTSDGQQSFEVSDPSGLTDLTFTEKGDLVLIGNDKKIHLYSSEGDVIRVVEAETELRLRTVSMVEVPKDECDHSLVVTGSSDGSLQLWDIYAEENQFLCMAKSSERLTCCTSLKM